MNRRAFVAGLGTAALLPACQWFTPPAAPPYPRLTARPFDQLPEVALPPGTHTLLAGGTTAVLHVPATAAGSRVPLMVFLHGSLRTVDAFLQGLRPAAETAGAALLLPYAVHDTWDAIRGSFGPDVGAIDAVLSWAFARVAVRADRFAIAGFSDGASYALALGQANGDVASRVIAHAPGLLLPVRRVGRSRYVVSHATDDPVLPYATTRDAIVPSLLVAGYEVDFRSFTGGHAVSMSTAVDTLQSLSAP